MPPYRPPNKVSTTQIPYLALVIAADPEFEKNKHWSPEYPDTPDRWVKFSDPYTRGSFNTPRKTVNVSYSGPQTFNAGDLTGIGNDFVLTLSNAAVPGVLTMRTAAQMFGDISGATPNLGYALRLVNFGGASDLMLRPVNGIVMFDCNWWGQTVNVDIISAGRFTDYQVQFPDPTHILMRRVAINQPYSAIVG
jgi:hypothetical protein